MIWLETSLVSGSKVPWGERERERERKIFFCPTYGPKRKFRKSREKPGWKKVKGLVFGEEREYGGETSCVFGDSI